MKTAVFLRTILLALVLVTALTAAACTGGKGTEPDGTAAGEETEGGASGVEKADLTAFSCTIVRGDESSKAVTDAAVELRRILLDAGIDADIKTDWVKRGEEIKRFPNEILIGPTNRPESEALYDRMEDEEPPFDYIVRVGAENTVAAPDGYIGEAALLFAQTYLQKLTEGTIGEVDEMERKHVFPKEGLTIFGKDAGLWTLVVPADYPEEARADVEAISAMIYELSGKRLPVTDAPGGAGNRILIGTASDLTPRSDDLACIVRYDGSDLHIGGGNRWADCRALYRHLLYEGFRADYSLNAPDCPDDVTLTDAADPDLSKDRFFSVSAWCTSGDAYDTEELVRQTAEAGFTKVNISGASDKALSLDLMKWCAIYDLQILWSGLAADGVFGETEWNTCRRVLEAPHVWGYYLRDEPNSSLFGTLAKSTADTAEFTDKIAFINLFPMYANEQQLGNPTYLEHIESFLDTVKPVWTAVDIYPLNAHGLYDGYLKNMDIVADGCRRRDVRFSVYLQSVSFHSSKRTPSKEDLAWQTWCIRSFGANEAIYFTYMTPYSSAEDFKPALIDHDLNRTDRWYAAQEINAQFALTDEAFARYPRNLGAFSVNADRRSPYLQFDNQYDFSAVLKEIRTENRVLFGCFTDDAGRYAFSLVNCGDLQKDSPASVGIRTDAPVTVWQAGIPTVLEPDGEGFVTVGLGTGEGVFCEVMQ